MKECKLRNTSKKAPEKSDKPQRLLYSITPTRDTCQAGLLKKTYLKARRRDVHRWYSMKEILPGWLASKPWAKRYYHWLQKKEPK